MYFAGRLQRPPWEQRKRVELMAKRLDRTHIANYGQRFRFTTLQTRLGEAGGVWGRGVPAAGGGGRGAGYGIGGYAGARRDGPARSRSHGRSKKNPSRPSAKTVSFM